MSEDTKLQQLIINTLSPEQMPEVLSETEIYLVEDDVEYASVDELNAHANNTTIHVTEQDKTNWNGKQNAISDLSTIRSNASTGAGLAPQVAVNTQRIEDLTTAKFPNVVIIGTPHIEGGQVSNYSDTSYLQFPFVDISRGQPFDIYFSFTTSNDITTQQNILDSYFGIALAIQNGKGIMALSSNGSNWDIGMATGTNTLLPNTTYYVKYSWTGTAYSASLSLNDETYVPDMNLTSSLSPYKTTIFIGGSPNLFGAGTAHPFKGTINFNKSKVVVGQNVVWEGMADVGLASRANVSLNNLDEVGDARFSAKQDVISDLSTIRDGASKGATAVQPVQLDSKQDTLVSGTNIKTINGEDVLGSGDLKLSTYHPPLLSCMWSDHLLNDIQWLRADTFSWQDGDVYETVYNTLVEEYNNGTEETYASGSKWQLTFRRTSKGFKIALPSQEQSILNRYNDNYDTWFYILDTDNKRFKLPRTKWGFKGLRDIVGNYIDESLPNITGSVYNVFASSENADKSLYLAKPTNPVYITTNSSSGLFNNIAHIDASRSSSTYKDNAPVQEHATQMYLYFYVGEYAQTAIEQTAGLNAELFNGKLDLNASNLNAQGKSYISGLGMPSTRYINLTLGASGTTYTAPANGYFLFRKLSTAAGQYMQIVETVTGLQYWITASLANTLVGATLPVRKGANVFIGYTLAGTANQIFRFIYAEGEQ